MLRVPRDIDWTQAATLCLITQNIFVTGVKKTKHEFRYFLNTCNFVKLFFFQVFAFSYDIWVIFYSIVWEIVPNCLQVTWYNIRWKMSQKKSLYIFERNGIFRKKLCSIFISKTAKRLNFIVRWYTPSLYDW